MSRTAFLGRYWMTLATCAALRLPYFSNTHWITSSADRSRSRRRCLAPRRAGWREALERQLVEDRVDRRDVEQVADRRVGCRTTALAEDAAAPGELHDVVDDQEVAGKILLLDDREFGLDARRCLPR
jgi:hypothetical protein